MDTGHANTFRRSLVTCFFVHAWLFFPCSFSAQSCTVNLLYGISKLLCKIDQRELECGVRSVLTSITSVSCTAEITSFFKSSKKNHFEIVISCCDKFCVGNSTLTLTIALCRPALRDTQSSVRYIYGNATSYHMWTYGHHVTRQAKEVFWGNLHLEHILFYFHNLFSATFWIRKEIKCGYSCSLYQILHEWYRQSLFLHSANASCKNGLSMSLVQDLAEKALVPKPDSYNHGCSLSLY